MREATKELSDIAQKAAQQVDEARVAKAEADLMVYMRDQQYGEDGFMRLKGENALTPDDNGASLQDRVLQGMDSKITELGATLTPKQRQIFINRSQGKRAAQFGVASQHVYRESQDFMVSSHQAQVDEAVATARLSYGSPDSFAQSVIQAIGATDAVADLQGMDDTMRTNARRKSVDAAVNEMVLGAIAASPTDPNAAMNALAGLNRYAKYMTPGLAQKLRNDLMAIADGQAQDRFVRNDENVLKPKPILEVGGKRIIDNAGFVPEGGVDDAAMRTFSAIMMTASGGGTHYDAAGNVKKVGDKYGMALLSEADARVAAAALGLDYEKEGAGYKLAEGEVMSARLGRQHLKSLIQSNGNNVVKAVGQYLFGDKELTDAEQGVVQSVMANVGAESDGGVYANGVKVSAFDSRLASSNGSGVLTIDEFRAMVNAKAASGDATALRAVADERFMRQLEAKFIKERASRIQALRESKSADLAAISDLIDQGKEIPPELWQRLTKSEQDEVTAYAEKVASADDSGSLDHATYLSTHLADFYAMSEAEMKRNIMGCPKVQGEQLKAAWYKHRMAVVADTNTRGDLKGQVDRGELGFDFFVKRDALKTAFRNLDPDTYHKMEKNGTLEQYITVAGEAIASDNQLRNQLGSKTTEREIELFMERLLAKSFKNDGGASELVLSVKKVSDIPHSGRGDVLDICRKMVQMRKGTDLEVSDKEALGQFYRIMLVPNVEVPEALLPYQEQSFANFMRAAGPGHSPTWYLRGWVNARLKGESPVGPSIQSPMGALLNVLYDFQEPVIETEDEQYE